MEYYFVEYYFGASNDIVWILMLEIHGTDDLRAKKKPPAVVVTWRLILYLLRQGYGASPSALFPTTASPTWVDRIH